MVAARCPFCGSDKQFPLIHADMTVFVYCDGCSAQGPSGEDEAAIWAAWNRRPEEERLNKEVAEAELENEIGRLSRP